MRSVSLQFRATTVAARVVDAIEKLLPMCTACDLIGEHGFRLTLAGDNFELTAQPSSIEFYYDDKDLALAKRAIEGDTSAVLGIAEQWSASATIDLAVPLRRAEPAVIWRVARSDEVVIRAFEALPWWRAGELLPNNNSPLICLLISSNKVVHRAPRFAVVDRSSLHELVTDLPSAKEELLAAAVGSRPPDGICLPEQLEVATGGGLPDLEQVWRAFAAASAWAWIANSVRIDSSRAWLEVFGLQRIRFELGPEGVKDPAAQQDALRLYEMGYLRPFARSDLGGSASDLNLRSC